MTSASPSDNVKDFQLVLKRKLENQQSGQYALTPPVVVGLLISYSGFKELGFVAGSSGNLWSIDLDVNKVFWQKNFRSGTREVRRLFRQGDGLPCSHSADHLWWTPPSRPRKPRNRPVSPRPPPAATPRCPPE